MHQQRNATLHPPPIPDSLHCTAVDMRIMIMSKLATDTLQTRLPMLSKKLPSDSRLTDFSAALQNIPATTIIETDELVYTTAAVILKMFDNKSRKTSHK